MKARLNLRVSQGTAEVLMTKNDKTCYYPQWQNYILNMRSPYEGNFCIDIKEKKKKKTGLKKNELKVERNINQTTKILKAKRVPRCSVVVSKLIGLIMTTALSLILIQHPVFMSFY